jgi:membrane associated rhomboid family serine protease
MEAPVSLRNLRNALIVMGAFLALIWILQVVNWADSYRLDQSFGIVPRNVGRLGDIFSAPFLHANWEHIEGNSVPLLVLGVAAAYRGIARFLAATAIIAILSGLTVWLFQSGNSVTIGASGIIFGYFGYVLVRGIVDRNLLDLTVGIAAGALYYSILAVAIPGTPGISWLGHLGGLIGGILAAWLLRAPRPALATRSSGAQAGARNFGGWTLGIGSGSGAAPGNGAGSGNGASPRGDAPRAGSARPRSTSTAKPTPGGSTSADDLLRQLDDMGF